MTHTVFSFSFFTCCKTFAEVTVCTDCTDFEAEQVHASRQELKTKF